MGGRIRLASPSDGAAASAIYAPHVEGSTTSFELKAPDGAEMAARIAALLPTHPWLVFEESGAVLGYAYGSPHRSRAAYNWCAEVSVYVAAAARRRGLGRALYAALFGVLRQQGFVNAYAGITLPNDASVGLHRTAGFVPIGTYERIGHKLGGWRDVLWMGLRLSDPLAPAERLLSPAEALRDPAVAALLAGAASQVA